MRCTVLMLVLCAGWSRAAAQTFTGTYTGQSPTGAVTLTIQQAADGSATGTYTEAGVTWQITGALVDGALQGEGSYPGAEFAFRLTRDQSGLLFEQVDYGPDGEPDESTLRQVRLTPAGAQPQPQPQPSAVPGDVNGDGALGVADVVLALRLAVKLPVAAPNPQAADVDGDGNVTLSDVLRLLRAAIGLAPLAPPATAGPDPDGVPRVAYDNPIAGFSITVPEDWEMATALGGNTEIAIDSASGASLWAQPAIWFFRSPLQPEDEARAMARELQLIGGGAVPQVRATGRPNEWEVTMTSNGVRGPLVERWLCRLENGHKYVVAAFAKPEFAARHQANMDVALESCHLIHRISSTVFREPTENAYRIRLPQGWRWVPEQSQIYRAPNMSGYFVWMARRDDGLVGCFNSLPGMFNLFTPYATPRECAERWVLDGLRKQVPDLQLESFHSFPRATDYFTAAVRAVGARDGLAERAYADYVGTSAGTRIRIRVQILTVKWGIDWNLITNGVWAPIDQWDRLYPIGRGVLSSLRTDPTWLNNQFRATTEVVLYRLSAMQKVADAWDEYIRDEPPPDEPPDPDPDNPPDEPPNGDNPPGEG